MVDCLVDAKLLERTVEPREGGEPPQQPHVDGQGLGQARVLHLDGHALVVRLKRGRVHLVGVRVRVRVKVGVS